VANAESPASARAGEPGPGAAALRLDLHLAELRQLFNSMDAAPFRERDLDPAAEEFIVEWARETPADAPLALAVHLSRAPAETGDLAILRAAVHEFFARAAAQQRLRLKRLFRTGRWNLLVGVAFVALAIFVGDWVGGLVGRYQYGRLIEDSMAIGAWVALWRPIEIFLYDWWPIRAEARLLERLSAMQVDIVDARPAAPAAGPSQDGA
jgi:hypothetical protein